MQNKESVIVSNNNRGSVAEWLAQIIVLRVGGSMTKVNLS